MASIASKKKILGNKIEKASHPKSRFIATVLHDDSLSPSANEKCIPDQGDRGRVIVFIDGSNLFYAALRLNTEIDYVKLLQ